MLFSEWDWTAAERSFQRALAINPNHAEAYLHYGGLMEALGQLTRGFELKLQGLECDSTSALAHVLIAVLAVESATVRRRDRVGEQGARPRSAPSVRS